MHINQKTFKLTPTYIQNAKTQQKLFQNHRESKIWIKNANLPSVQAPPVKSTTSTQTHTHTQSKHTKILDSAMRLKVKAKENCSSRSYFAQNHRKVHVQTWKWEFYVSLWYKCFLWPQFHHSTVQCLNFFVKFVSQIAVFVDIHRSSSFKHIRCDRQTSWVCKRMFR